MAQDKMTELIAFLLRLALGAMFIVHFFCFISLPPWNAYAVFALEAVGGIMLVLGIRACWVALALAPNLAGATWTHWGNGWMLGYANGGWEYPLYLTLLASFNS